MRKLGAVSNYVGGSGTMARVNPPTADSSDLIGVFYVEILVGTAIEGEHVLPGFVIDRCPEELAADLVNNGKAKARRVDCPTDYAESIDSIKKRARQHQQSGAAASSVKK